ILAGDNDVDDEPFPPPNAHRSSVTNENSLNGSSSFLFDSLYDSSLLAGFSHDSHQSEEEKEGTVVMETSLLSNQQRQRSGLIANQEAEEQEAVQWGESSFNLSEWGDSLLVGEHFLERRSLLRHTEGLQHEQDYGQTDRPQPDHGETEQQGPQPNHSNDLTTNQLIFPILSTNQPPPLDLSTNQLTPPTSLINQQSLHQTSPQPKTLQDSPPVLSPPSSLTDEGFTLQLSQDASLSPSSPSGGLAIIDVASDRTLFYTFIEEWRRKERYSLVPVCQTKEQGGDRGIGGRQMRGLPRCSSGGVVLTGLAVCWGGTDCYYISLLQQQSTEMSSSLAPPPLAADLPVGERVEQMRACLSKSLADGAGGVVMTYDIIQVYKTLVLSYGISLEGPCEDMKVASWLLDPGGEERTLTNMVTCYCPSELPLLDGHTHSPRLRAAIDSVLIHSTMGHLTTLLEKDGLIGVQGSLV
uniref:DNA polymerase theta-like n=1 Tax=Oncorhynchus gorbuscha TaxID=8017 RepID=UPI001EAECB0C